MGKVKKRRPRPHPIHIPNSETEIRVYFRSAITGRYVKKEYAQKNPKTTVKETTNVRLPKKKK